MESGEQGVKPRRKSWIMVMVVLLVVGLLGARLWVLIARDVNCPEGFTRVPAEYLRCETDTNDLPALAKCLGLDGISECAIVCSPNSGRHVEYSVYHRMPFESIEHFKRWLSGDAYAMRFTACCGNNLQIDGK